MCTFYFVDAILALVTAGLCRIFYYLLLGGVVCVVGNCFDMKVLLTSNIIHIIEREGEEYGATEPALLPTSAPVMAPQIFERGIYCIFDLLFGILAALFVAVLSNFIVVISIIGGIIDFFESLFEGLFAPEIGAYSATVYGLIAG